MHGPRADRRQPPQRARHAGPTERLCARVARHAACSLHLVANVASHGRVRALAATCAALTVLAAGCERVEYRAFPGDSIRSGWASPERPSGLALASVQREFLNAAAQSNLFEISASRIALARGGSAAVRRFAETMLRDRVSVDTDLQQLAASVGVALPSRLDEDLQARLVVLEQLTGNEFDRAYARNAGVLAQEEALAAFERAADRHGERVQRFAADRIPALRKHLERARQLASEIDKTEMA
jgi:putative membrane protein